MDFNSPTLGKHLTTQPRSPGPLSSSPNSILFFYGVLPLQRVVTCFVPWGTSIEGYFCFYNNGCGSLPLPLSLLSSSTFQDVQGSPRWLQYGWLPLWGQSRWVSSFFSYATLHQINRYFSHPSHIQKHLYSPQGILVNYTWRLINYILFIIVLKWYPSIKLAICYCANYYHSLKSKNVYMFDYIYIYTYI